MPIHNQDIAAIFEEIADRLEIDGSNPFRIRAYRAGARTVEGLPQAAQVMLEQDEDLTELPGIGKDLAAKIAEIVETGSCKALHELREKMPAGITDLLRLPGLGPKRVKILLQELKITSVDDLKKAAEKHEIQSLPGFGKKTEEQILQSIRSDANAEKRYLLAATVPYVESLLAYLRKVKGVKKIEVAGSYRRSKETVGDIDILVSSPSAAPIMDAFVKYDEVTQVLAKGKTKSSVVLRFGIQVDLRVVEAKSYGAALHYFTGSKEHNIAMRKLAQKKGLKVNEYGVFDGDEQVAGKTEQEIYELFAMSYVPPELREDRGEMDAAASQSLPKLVEQKHIKGDLHMHSTHSDGACSIREMAEAARERGLSYIAITDHSKRLTIANGLDENRLLKQIDEIDALNGELSDITLLKGIEVDILESGELDLSDDVLSRLDLVVASVHSKFALPEKKQTERILRAMDHPYCSILGHPTGRLLLSRQPYACDVAKIVAHAKERGCFLELNANPQRLDLNDIYCQMAKEQGVLLSINTDAHSTEGLDNLCFGIGQARRGWLTKGDVLNTRSLGQLKKLLKGTMG